MNEQDSLSTDSSSAAPRPHESRRVLLGALFVACYACLVYLPFLGSSRTLTRHEVMVSHPALRMLSDGEWLVPRYSSGRWLDKPPLVSWLTAACFAVFGGFSELPARLPAALSAVGLCVLVFLLAERFFSQRAAVFAGLMQATCVYMYMQGRLGEIDMPFALFLAGAHVVLIWQWGRGRMDLPIGAALLFHALVGLAVLSKGVLGVLIVGFTVLAYCALSRSWRPLRATVFTPGISAFLLITVPWHVAAYFIAGQEALDQWRYNSLMRFLGLHHLGGSSPAFYLYTVPWLMLPWSVVLVIGAPALWRAIRRSKSGVDRALWAWFMGGLVFFTLCFFKHKHYVIPILPPLTILAAKLLDLHYSQIGVHRRRLVVGVFVALPIVLGIVSGAYMPRRDHRRVTAEFVRNETSRVPEDKTLFVIGLGQSMAYPYVQHNDCVYIDSAATVQETLARRKGRPMWVIAPRKHLPAAELHGLVFTEIAAEPVRKKHPWQETIVLGQLTRRTDDSTSTRPADPSDRVKSSESP